jgi:PAS domain S-box-containing protein
MRDEAKTKKQLIDELKELRQHADAAQKTKEELDRLRKSQEIVAKTFLQSATAMAISTIEDGLYIDANEAFLDMVERERDEVVGHTSTGAGIITEKERAALIHEFTSKGRVASYEIPVHSKDGKIKDVLINSSRVNLGGRDYLLTIIKDLSIRKKAEKEWQRSEQKYRNIIENAIEGIYQTTPQGRFVTVNPALVRMLGYDSEEELVGHVNNIGGELYVDPGRREELIRIMNEEGFVSGFEFRLYRKDKKIIWGSQTARKVVDENGNFLYLEGIVEDITERKRAVAELQRLNEELVRSNRDLEQFAYVASHDLQEPLRMVSSFSQLLSQRYADKLDQDGQDFIKFAVDGANRMQRLIQDLLAFSRISTRGKPFEPVDLHEALGEALKNLNIKIDETNAVVMTEALPRINADKTQIMQVFQNLIDNAVKFCKKHEQPQVHITAESAGSEWIISVRDNGIGIEPQYFERIFKIFQRLHTNKEYSGTGIGLALCHKIVTRHGGRIWVESKEGEGARFCFALPDRLNTEAKGEPA